MCAVQCVPCRSPGRWCKSKWRRECYSFLSNREDLRGIGGGRRPEPRLRVFEPHQTTAHGPLYFRIPSKHRVDLGLDLRSCVERLPFAPKFELAATRLC